MLDFTEIPLDIQPDSIPCLSRREGDVENCIDNILDLIVFTPRGTFIADPEFGFEYWNHEFANINVREFNNNYLGLMSKPSPQSEVSRKQCEASLKESILTYEPRLHDPEVRVELDINHNMGRRNAPSKYEMHILISGSIDDGLGVTRPYEKRISFMVEPIARKISI